MSVMWIIVLHPYSKFEDRRPSCSKIWLIFGHGVNPPGDLSTSKWDHGSPVSLAAFLPIFSFQSPSIVDFGSGMGTDGQMTDNGHQ